MTDRLAIEIASRLEHGATQMSVIEFCARFRALGYKVDRSMDCRSEARLLATGRTYPCCTTGLQELDTGMSAFHYQARRDDNFKAMQALRNDIFAVSRGAILEI